MPKSSWSDLLARTARAALSFLSSSGTTAPETKKSGTRPAGSRPTGGRSSGTGSAASGGSARPAPTRPTGSGRPTVPGPRESDGYPGDFRGRVDPVYSPALDGDADPGEIVWTWVPYEEDYSQGKDRPVLVIGHDGDWLLGLMLTSKDNTRKQRTNGPRWMDIGAGPWDARGRDSEVRLDRVLRLDPDAVRREGAIMDRATFDSIVGKL